MKLPSVHVLVSFRFDSGVTIPRDKQLMARVFYPEQPTEYGSPIAGRKRITGFVALKTEIVKECSKYTDTIHIHVDCLVSNYLRSDMLSQTIELKKDAA